MNPIRYDNGVIRAIHKQYLAGSGSYVNWVRPRNGATFRAGSVLLTLMLAQAGRPTLAQCYYTYQEIPHPPGNPPQFTAGHALNNLGHVAGRYSTGGDTARAFFWSPETGTYLLPYPPGIIDMVAYGINDLDQVCGSMTSTTRWYGFVWDRETGHYTTIDFPESQYIARDINNEGVVTGTPAFRWQAGVLDRLNDDLGVPFSNAYAVNERGEICGEGGTALDRFGFVLHSDGLTWLPRPGEFSNCEADTLSHTGFVVGRGEIGYPEQQFAYRGVIWTPNDVHVIAPPPNNRDAFMTGVNDAGRAVGHTYDGPSPYAFVWQNGRITDLNLLVEPGTRRLASSRGINASGQIIATRGVLTPVWLSGDLTGDCHVSIEDLVLVLTNFGLPRGTYPRGDVNSDGEVDVTDLAILLAHWGE